MARPPRGLHVGDGKRKFYLEAGRDELMAADDAQVAFEMEQAGRLAEIERCGGQAHLDEFTCPRCKGPLGLGPADGIDDKAYHLGCAAIEREERKTTDMAAD